MLPVFSNTVLSRSMYPTVERQYRRLLDIRSYAVGFFVHIGGAAFKTMC